MIPFTSPDPVFVDFFRFFFFVVIVGLRVTATIRVKMWIRGDATAVVSGLFFDSDRFEERYDSDSLDRCRGYK